MIKSSLTEKYIIVDFGASLIHTHHSQSIYSFFSLLKSKVDSPEIWVPRGSNLNPKTYPIRFNLLPGTHPCSFKFFSPRTWASGFLGKIHQIALKFDLIFLLKLLVYFTSHNFCRQIVKLDKKFNLSIIFPTICPFSIKSIYDLEKRKINAKIFCRITNTSEVGGILNTIYSINSLLVESQTFLSLKLRFGAETNHSLKEIKNLNVNSYTSKFPSLEQNAHKEKKDSNIVVSFLGHPTRDKGQEHIIPIIREVNKRRKDIKWQVHIYEYDPIELYLKESVPDIYLIKGKVKSEVIEQALATSDVLCLPYNVSAFKHKASAMHYQSSDYKKPVLTFDGTEFADDIKNFKSGASAKDLSELCKIISDLSPLQIKEWKKGCENYNIFRNSTNLEFLDLL